MSASQDFVGLYQLISKALHVLNILRGYDDWHDLFKIKRNASTKGWTFDDDGNKAQIDVVHVHGLLPSRSWNTHQAFRQLDADLHTFAANLQGLSRLGIVHTQHFHRKESTGSRLLAYLKQEASSLPEVLDDHFGYKPALNMKPTLYKNDPNSAMRHFWTYTFPRSRAGMATSSIFLTTSASAALALITFARRLDEGKADGQGLLLFLLLLVYSISITAHNHLQSLRGDTFQAQFSLSGVGVSIMAAHIFGMDFVGSVLAFVPLGLWTGAVVCLLWNMWTRPGISL